MRMIQGAVTSSVSRRPSSWRFSRLAGGRGYSGHARRRRLVAPRKLRDQSRNDLARRRGGLCRPAPAVGGAGVRRPVAASSGRKKSRDSRPVTAIPRFNDQRAGSRPSGSSRGLPHPCAQLLSKEPFCGKRRPVNPPCPSHGRPWCVPHPAGCPRA